MCKPDTEGPITRAELGYISLADRGRGHFCSTFTLPTLFAGEGKGKQFQAETLPASPTQMCSAFH